MRILGLIRALCHVAGSFLSSSKPVQQWLVSEKQWKARDTKKSAFCPLSVMTVDFFLLSYLCTQPQRTEPEVALLGHPSSQTTLSQ